jgi:hypothetical protein
MADNAKVGMGLVGWSVRLLDALHFLGGLLGHAILLGTHRLVCCQFIQFANHR